MKLTYDLLQKFNDQITLEFEASMVYRQLAIAADDLDLSGMASWLRHQADEEIVHANKFIDHVADRDSFPTIGAIPAPPVQAGLSALEIFRAALEHEQKVSEAIRELYRATESAGDLNSRPLLNWFVDEQIEEEATVSDIIGRLRLVGEDGSGVLRLRIDADQPAWRTQDGEMRVSNLQTGVSSGPAGSSTGQHRHRPDLTVVTPTPTRRCASWCWPAPAPRSAPGTTCGRCAAWTGTGTRRCSRSARG